jgi:hypothetical protein
MNPNSADELVPKEKLADFVKQAIFLLFEGQVSDTLILSSYKISTVLKQKLGKSFKIDRIGRSLARIAKQKKLKKLATRVPKYEIRKSEIEKFNLTDETPAPKQK